MDFLPKELENIITDYKNQLEIREEHENKMKDTLYTINNLEIFVSYQRCPFSTKTVQCSYYLNSNDKNTIITRTAYTYAKGMRVYIQV